MKSLRKICILAFAVLTLFMLAACEEDGDDGDGDNNPPIVEGSIVLNPSSMSIVAGASGGTLLVALLTDIDETPEWSSSDTAIATVTPNTNPTAATVRGLAPGTATISVTAGGVTATSTVTVTPGEFLTVANNQMSLQVGTTDTIIATAHTTVITYESQNPDFVTVSSTGVVTAIAEGSSIITVRAGTKIAYVTVKVEEPGIGILEVDNIILQLDSNPSATLTATGRGGINPATGTWTIEDDTVATIEQTGGVVTITALETGVGKTTTVTFTLGDFEPLTRTVTVKDIDLEVELDQILITMAVGVDEAKLTATVVPEQTGEDAEVTWTANPVGVINIAADGTITRNTEYVFAADEVSVTVTATSKRDPEASTSATVVVESPTKGQRIISNKAEFEAVMQGSANNAAHITLTANIDLEGKVYNGTIMSGIFSGTFNGNGYTISNFSAHGVFYEISGTVENVKIVGTNTGTNTGLVATRILATGILRNAIIDVTHTSAGDETAAIALFGRAEFVIIISRNLTGDTVRRKSAYVQAGATNYANQVFNYNAVGTVGASGVPTITLNQLQTASRYATWDTDIWNIVDGETPTLKQT